MVRAYLHSPMAMEEESQHDMGLASQPNQLTPKYACGFARQLYVLSGRQLSNLVRHPLLFSLQYGAVLAAALAIGTLFYNTGCASLPHLA